ncbi:Nif3-like dinuclear metal center hexameric protein [Legionella lytica]|uniref:Nif3-like dinuclear metal center hexameric protein n=1 Tax=Legionella lytica TaxID=96232 RepID=A0ABW8D613_9GAMM
MISQKELTSHLQQLLSCDRFNDYTPNGLQVEGKEQIKRICTAVTASDEVISQAIDWKADALLVHHGYFWRGESSVITGMKRQRLQKLLNHEINLLAYHLPLDCHLDLGNNACLAKLFEVNSIQMHRVGGTDNLLWSGELATVMTNKELNQFLAGKLGRQPLMIEGHNRKVSRIAWCSGGAQDYITEAHRLGVDAYLSGEVSERTYYEAQELGINYYACGHHATERYGIQALGEYLSSYFDLEYVFFDSANPV